MALMHGDGSGTGCHFPPMEFSRAVIRGRRELSESMSHHPRTLDDKRIDWAPLIMPRRRNLWITDTLQERPRARLAQPASPMRDSAASAFCSL